MAVRRPSDGVAELPQVNDIGKSRDKVADAIGMRAKDNQRLSQGRGAKGLTKLSNLLDTTREIAKIAGPAQL